MSEDSTIEMFVAGLVMDPQTRAPVVILKDEDDDIHLPIWIGIAEATSIASCLRQLEMGRPLTHDLLKSVLDEASMQVERIVISELRDSTYFADLVITEGERTLVLDVRPSDAIAMALRCSSPIHVTSSVLQSARESFEQEPVVQEGDPEEEESSDHDFKNIDKDKWKELLESLEADDFKYKM